MAAALHRAAVPMPRPPLHCPRVCHWGFRTREPWSQRPAQIPRQQFPQIRGGGKGRDKGTHPGPQARTPRSSEGWCPRGAPNSQLPTRTYTSQNDYGAGGAAIIFDAPSPLAHARPRVSAATRSHGHGCPLAPARARCSGKKRWGTPVQCKNAVTIRPVASTGQQALHVYTSWHACAAWFGSSW